MIAPSRMFENGPPRFEEGQLVKHLRYDYRGVIVALDRECQASEAWYQSNKSQPEREQPWYHVLVDGATHSTYVAESNLTLDVDSDCIVHPWVTEYFDKFDQGRYHRNLSEWPHQAP